MLISLIFFLCLGFVHQTHYRFATPVSRLDLLHAVVKEGTCCIDRWHTNTCDKAVYQGHYYSDKAPGTAALALPAFWTAAKIGEAAGIPLESENGWLITCWAACAFSQALPAAIGAAVLVLWLRRFVRPTVAWVTVFALWIGGLPLPYSTWLYSHAQVIGLIATAIWAMDLFGEDVGDVSDSFPTWDPETVRWRMALAGFCLGLALASEYTAGLVVVGLGLYVLWKRRSGLVPFALGAIPPLLLIPAYSWVTIGTPFDLPYSYQASFPQMKHGLYSIGWPNGYILALLLGSARRGLVFWTPFLLMAVVGWFRIAGEGRGRWLGWVYALPILHVVVISGKVWYWTAGYCISARYMAPIWPLLTLPCAKGLERLPKVGALLAGISIVLMTWATVTDVCFPSPRSNPLLQIVLPNWATGNFSYNLISELTGLPRWVGVLVFYGVVIGGFDWGYRVAERMEDKRGG